MAANQRPSAQMVGVLPNRNEARALRLLEIMNDYRTLQTHIHAHVTRPGAAPPTAEARALLGYQVLARCQSDARRILGTNVDMESLGLRPGNIPDGEEQRRALRRIILDASTRRFQAQRIYMFAAAAIRWVMQRNAIAQQPSNRQQTLLAQANATLQNEIQQATETHVYRVIREHDTQRGYWIDEDPTLEQITAYLRTLQ